MRRLDDDNRAKYEVMGGWGGGGGFSLRLCHLYVFIYRRSWRVENLKRDVGYVHFRGHIASNAVRQWKKLHAI